MKKLSIFFVFLGVLLASLFGGWTYALAGCVLSVDWSDGMSDFQLSVDGKAITGQLSITNNDTKSCKVNADVRIYTEILDISVKMVSKSIAFGSIKSGNHKVKNFSITAKTGNFFGKTLVVILNPKVSKDASGTVERNDGIATSDMPIPNSAPDLSVEWLNGFIDVGLHKISGEIKITNHASATDTSNNAGKFRTTVYSICNDRKDGITKKKILKHFRVSGLNAGESIILPFSYSQKQVISATSFVAVVNYYDDIYENDHENNQVYSDGPFGYFCGDDNGLKILPIAFNFGPIKVGTSENALIKTILNCGATPVTLTNLSLTGEDFAANFDGPVIIPSAEEGIATGYVSQITFAPLSRGVKTGVLTIETDDPAFPEISLPLAGKGK